MFGLKKDNELIKTLRRLALKLARKECLKKKQPRGLHSLSRGYLTPECPGSIPA